MKDSILKRICFLILFKLLVSNFSYSQEEICNNIDFSNSILEQARKQSVNIVLTNHINSNYKSDLCKLKFYAYLVDELFSQGLDLEMEFMSEYRDNTIVTDTLLNLRDIFVDSTLIKYQVKKNLFFYFVEINKSFNAYYSINRNKLNFNQTITHILDYGIFNNAEKIEMFLNHKYSKISKQKYYDYIRSRRN